MTSDSYSPPNGLEQKQYEFCLVYAETFNAKLALKTAGYSDSYRASKLLDDQMIIKTINEILGEHDDHEIDVEAAWARKNVQIWMGNLNDFIDPDTGDMLPPDKIDRHTMAAAKSYERIERTMQNASGSESVTITHKYQLHDQNKAMELFARRRDMFAPIKIQEIGGDELVQRMNDAKRRITEGVVITQRPNVGSDIPVLQEPLNPDQGELVHDNQ